MTRIIRSVVLASLLATGTAAVVSMSPAIAQTTKGAPKVEPKVEPKGGAKTEGTVIYRPGKDGKFRFSVINKDGKTLAMSVVSGFEKPEDCLKALEEVKAILNSAKPKLEKAKVEEKKDSK